MPINNPLNEEDLKGINDNLATLDDLDAQLKLARQAGVNVDESMQRSRENRVQLLKLKSTYFPASR